jgi:peptidoglycan/LPS O-acetylase OafA/YrhL
MPMSKNSVVKIVTVIFSSSSLNYWRQKWIWLGADSQTSCFLTYWTLRHEANLYLLWVSLAIVFINKLFRIFTTYSYANSFSQTTCNTTVTPTWPCTPFSWHCKVSLSTWHWPVGGKKVQTGMAWGQIHAKIFSSNVQSILFNADTDLWNVNFKLNIKVDKCLSRF